MAKSRRINAIIASCVICLATMLLLVRYSFPDYKKSEWLKFIICISYLFGIVILVFTFTRYIIFNTGDEQPNLNKNNIVQKLRLRALLFNNLSVIILFFILITISISFYYLITPITNQEGRFAVVAGLTVTAVTISLIFLVQIAFRVFKYVLRVAAFYNGRADAIEYSQFDPGANLIDMMKIFTPSDYDISDLEPTSTAVAGQGESIEKSDKKMVEALTGANASAGDATTKGSLLLQRGKEVP